MDPMIIQQLQQLHNLLLNQQQQQEQASAKNDPVSQP